MALVLDATRLSDSPLVDTVSRGRTLAVGAVTRPAEVHWHMVLSKRPEKTEFLLVGPWSSAGAVSIEPEGEVLWIRFKVGVYMPHLLTARLCNRETPLPEASGNNFWLKSTAWQFPTYENADTFVDRLVRDELLALDPLVQTTLHGRIPDVSPRTLRHRFRQTTGVSQNQIFQVRRAWQAEALLRQGTPVLDVIDALGYYDQPHLTRSLKQLIGFTPAQMLGQPGVV